MIATIIITLHPTTESVMLDLAKPMDKSIHLLKGLQDLAEALGTRYHDLSRDEDQEGHLRTLEAVHQSGE